MDPYTKEQVLDNQLELFYHSSVQTQDVAWKTCRKRWMMDTNTEIEREREREREFGKSVVVARHDDDNDIYWELEG